MSIVHKPSPDAQHAIELWDRLLRLADLGARMRRVQGEYEATPGSASRRRRQALQREFDRECRLVLAKVEDAEGSGTETGSPSEVSR